MDDTIWPLLTVGLSVRAIATKADTSTATVGRSRQRWIAAGHSVLASQDETDTPTSILPEYETVSETK